MAWLTYLPTHQQSWNGKKIKVILLEETSSDATEIVSNAATTESDFFSYAGIWESRDINQESIRAKGWRDNKRGRVAILIPRKINNQINTSG